MQAVRAAREDDAPRMIMIRGTDRHSVRSWTRINARIVAVICFDILNERLLLAVSVCLFLYKKQRSVLSRCAR